MSAKLTSLVPVLVSVAFVLTVFADTGVLLFELPRALVWSAAVAIAVQLVAILALRSVRRGSWVAAMLLESAIDARLGVVALGLVVAWFYFRRTGRRFDLEWPLLGFVSVMFAISLTRAPAGGAFAVTDLIRQEPPAGTRVEGDPDVVLVLLDGYPRSDTLSQFGYDNTWFENALRDRGFEIAERAHSNYDYTGLVLASMFNMRHIQDVPALAPPPPGNVAQHRAVTAAINHNPVLDMFDGRGYETVSTGLTAANGTLWAVDDYEDDGTLRLWERQVLRRTSIWPMLRDLVVVPEHRALVRNTIGSIGGIVQSRAGEPPIEPLFLFAHVMSPHTPLVFAADGSSLNLECGDGCLSLFSISASAMGLSPQAYETAAAAQVHYLNTLLIEQLDEVISASPNAVVVLFSDHGARSSDSPTDEWFRSFFAARTPGHPSIFSADARPIEVFPRLFDAYFDTDLPVPADRSYDAVQGIFNPLSLRPWP